MGKGKHCTPEKRDLVKKLISEGKTYREIQNLIGCSPTTIRNAITYTPKLETRGRKPVMSPKLIKRVVRHSKINPFTPATQIKDIFDLTVSVETLRRRLREHGQVAPSPKKLPLLTKKDVAKRIKFAKEHLNWPVEKWRNVLWSDETKIILYGGKGSRQYLRRPPNAEYNPRFTAKTIKHGGSSIMVWASFSFYGVGPLHRIEGIMDQHLYVKILEDVMLPYAEDEMPLVWVFQQDNDPKHTSKRASSGSKKRELK